MKKEGKVKNRPLPLSTQKKAKPSYNPDNTKKVMGISYQQKHSKKEKGKQSSKKYLETAQKTEVGIKAYLLKGTNSSPSQKDSKEKRTLKVQSQSMLRCTIPTQAFFSKKDKIELVTRCFYQFQKRLSAIESTINRQEGTYQYMQKQVIGKVGKQKVQDLHQHFKNIIAKIKQLKQRLTQRAMENEERIRLQEEKNKDLQSCVNRKEKEIQQLSKKLSQVELQRRDQKMEDRSFEDEQKVYSQFFYANIMQDEYLFQQYLTNIIHKIKGRFRNTKLIYQWHPLNKTNIHQFIDNINDLVFLIRTEEEYHIAAYTESPFSQTVRDLGAGAIISLTNRRAFPTKPGQKAISYDHYYVRFGNSELQIKGADISSNLGTAGGHFQVGSDRADILFGGGKKASTKIAQMEVFQLIF